VRDERDPLPAFHSITPAGSPPPERASAARFPGRGEFRRSGGGPAGAPRLRSGAARPCPTGGSRA
jgi:hypothetical protein